MKPCPKCGNELCEEKAINLRNGAERLHWHCLNCDYDTMGMYEEKTVFEDEIDKFMRENNIDPVWRKRIELDRALGGKR